MERPFYPCGLGQGVDMKTVLKTTLAASLAWAIAGSAWADPFDTFVDLCIDTDASAAAVAATAKGAGWSRAPESLAAAAGTEFRDPVVYMNKSMDEFQAKGAADELELVFAGWGASETVMDVAGMRIDFCMVGAPSWDGEALGDQFKTFVGFSPVPLKSEAMEGWVFSRGPAGFVSEAALIDMQEDEAIAAMQGKPLYLAFAVKGEGFSGLIYAKVKDAD